MLNHTLLTGKLVRLGAIDPEEAAPRWAKWRQNSEYDRLLDLDPAVMHSTKAVKAWIEKHLDDWLKHEFHIRAIENDQLLGFVGLGSEGAQQLHGEAYVGIGIGEPDFWGKGYGTEAMRLVLHYGFAELNLHRISLNVFAYNERAIHSYEKAGFKLEGRARGLILRDGLRWDVFSMGILRHEWEQMAQPE